LNVNDKARQEVIVIDRAAVQRVLKLATMIQAALGERDVTRVTRALGASYEAKGEQANKRVGEPAIQRVGEGERVMVGAR
jgi:hypothetical protein